MSRVPVLAVLGVVVVVIVVVIGTLGGDAQPAAPTESLMHPDTQGPAGENAVVGGRAPEVSAGPSTHQRVDAAGQLVVVDAMDRSAIANASLTLFDKSEVPSPTFTLKATSQAKPDGSIPLSSAAQSCEYALVRAPGHVPRVFRDRLPAMVVDLQRAGGLSVNVIDTEGRSVPDARVVLTADGSTGFLGTSEPPESGIGHPLSDRPRWVTQCNQQGKASFSELPPDKRYYMNIFHKELVPLTDVGANGAVWVPSGYVEITATLQELYAVAFRCPSLSPIESLNWELPQAKLDRSIQVLSRVGAVRQYMMDRLPGCLVYVHKPDQAGQEVFVGCHLSLEDGTLWHGRWPLAPMHTVRDPVFLELRSAPARTLVVKVLDSTNTSIEGIPIVLRSRRGGMQVSSVTGHAFRVECDEYAVSLAEPSDAIEPAFADRVLKVDAATPEEHVIKLSNKIVEVIVRARLPPTGNSGPVEVYLRGEGGSGASIGNWRPSRGPIRRFLDAGNIRLKVRSVLYDDIDLSSPAGDGAVVFDIELVERQRAK